MKQTCAWAFGTRPSTIADFELAKVAGNGTWRRWYWRAGGGAAALVALALAVGASGPLFSAAPAAHYRLAAIESGPVIAAISTAGTLKPLAAIQVGSQMSGQIKDLVADFNSPVRAGDVIARFDDEAVRAHLAQALVEVEIAATAVEIQRAQLQHAEAEAEGAKAALPAAEAEVGRAEASLNDADRDRDRKLELFARGSGSAAERDRSELAYQTARTQLAVAKARLNGAGAAQAGSDAAVHIARAQLDNAIAQVRQREAAAQQVRIDLDHTIIRAPIDGVVIARTVDVGQTVAASLQTPTLFTIAPDLRAMEVHANVDEADIGRVVAGQDVSFTVDSYPGRAFPGRVVDIRKMPQTTQNVVTYTVVISAENEDLLLLPGMTANVRIFVQRRHDVLTLPNAALRFRPAGTAAAPATAPSDPPPARLLRTALDRIGLSPDRRAELEEVVNAAGCVAAEATAPADGPADRCREAANGVFGSLTPAERAQYQAARSQLVREQRVTSADVWMIGPTGAPEARRLQLGISDGLVTEIVAGNVRKGDRVIVGAAAETARATPLPGF